MRGRGGFSLIEMAIAIAVAGMIAGPALLVLGNSLKRRKTQEMDFIAASLAQDLMEEVASKAFEDPNLAQGSFGTEEASRALYDDVDDFDGLVDSPPQDRTGVPLVNMGSFSRTVIVENVAGPFLDLPVADGTTAYKRVTVTVAWSGGSFLLRTLSARL